METTPKENKWTAVISLGLVTLTIVALIFFISEEMDAVRAFILSSGWLGLLISVALYGLLGLSPIPSEPLTVLLSTVYNPLIATIVAGTGNLLAAVMEYILGERISSIASFEERKKHLPFGLGRLPVSSVPFLLIARALPGYGPKFVSLLSGIYRVPIHRYLWTSAVVTFIGAAIFAYGGFGILQLLPQK